MGLQEHFVDGVGVREWSHWIAKFHSDLIIGINRDIYIYRINRINGNNDRNI